jgi:hypothetical protein
MIPGPLSRAAFYFSGCSADKPSEEMRKPCPS